MNFMIRIDPSDFNIIIKRLIENFFIFINQFYSK
jgi:hypothetical protein